MVFLKPLRTTLVRYADIAGVAGSGRTDAFTKAKRAGRQEELDGSTVVQVWGLKAYRGSPIPVIWVLYGDETNLQELAPMPLGRFMSARSLSDVWIFQHTAYITKDLALTAEDVRALLNQDANKRRLALDKAHALQAMSEQLDRPRQRERISQEVRIEVWQRDGGRCVECESQQNLEFDHIIPFGMGGSNTARNLQLLCGDCNRRKGMTLG